MCRIMGWRLPLHLHRGTPGYVTGWIGLRNKILPANVNARCAYADISGINWSVVQRIRVVQRRWYGMADRRPVVGQHVSIDSSIHCAY